MFMNSCANHPLMYFRSVFGRNCGIGQKIEMDGGDRSAKLKFPFMGLRVRKYHNRFGNNCLLHPILDKGLALGPCIFFAFCVLIFS